MTSGRGFRGKLEQGESERGRSMAGEANGEARMTCIMHNERQKTADT